MIKLTVQQVHNRATDNSFKRGQSYQRDGAIFDTVRRGDDIEAFCQGSDVRPYQVKASLNERGIGSTSCTCQYDFQGDCKHIVALLLTYVDDPQAFVERPKLEDSLADRDKDELIALIGQMVKRYPDLQTLVERPTPGKTRSTPVVNTDSFRHELRRAMQTFGEWGEYPGVEAIESVQEAAEAFEQKDDWRSASLIYRTILEEASADTNAFYSQDEEGEFSMALDEVIMALGKCLDHLADDATLRTEIFKSILDVVIWNIDDVGRDIGLDVFDDILRHAKPEDIAAIRAQIEVSEERKRHDVYGQWGIGVYESFLADLDTLDNVDPEVTLSRLRENALYRVLFEKLLALGRHDEAITVVREHLTNLSDRLLVLPRLVEAGYDDTAIQLARELLNFKQGSDYANQFHNNTVIEWLLTRYTARGDRVASLELQLERMKAMPRIEFYRELKNTAQTLDRWETLHPIIIQQFQQARLFDVLTRIYMEEQNWDAAWDTLTKTGNSTASPMWQHSTHLDLEVASASGHARPERAIPVYRKYVKKAIDQRSRQHYQEAAGYLATLRDLYRKIGSEAEWVVLIAQIKTEFKKLPALQEELKRARL